MAVAEAIARPSAGGPDVRKFDTGVGAKNEALRRVELAAEAIADIGARLKSNKCLRKALKAWKQGDTAKTAKFALEATKADPTNPQAFQLLGIALEKLGHVHEALVTYEQALTLDPEDTDLLLNLGLTAWNLNFLDGAERMFRIFIEKRPDHPAGYNNLGSVMRDRGNLAGAIEMLRGAIYRMPDQAMLWNTLATALAEEGRAEESLVFYQEAARLDPKFARVWHNLGYAYLHLGRFAEARAAYASALDLVDNAHERIETRHSRSICLIALGELEEGFKEYEIRNTPEFRAYVLHYTKAPLWRGEDLTGKRVLVVGEQGLGDEFMFANTVPDLDRAVGNDGKLQIAVDPRLVPLFQRSFPSAEVGTYEDGKLEQKPVRIFPWARKDGDPDFYLPMGAPLQYFRKRVDDFPRQAYLKADSQKTAQFRARLSSLGPGPYVGVCWRSMVLGAKRSKYFSAIEAWKPILSYPGATFVNLQYGDVASELKSAREKLSVSIHNFDDVNLRNDIESGAALSSACDLVISAPTAAAALAGALGVETWFIVAGRGWPQLGTDHYPWYRQCRPRVRKALEHFSASSVGGQKDVG